MGEVILTKLAGVQAPVPTELLSAPVPASLRPLLVEVPEGQENEEVNAPGVPPWHTVTVDAPTVGGVFIVTIALPSVPQQPNDV